MLACSSEASTAGSATIAAVISTRVSTALTAPAASGTQKAILWSRIRGTAKPMASARLTIASATTIQPIVVASAVCV